MEAWSPQMSVSQRQDSSKRVPERACSVRVCVRYAGCTIGMMRVSGLPCDRDWLRVPPVSGGFPIGTVQYSCSMPQCAKGSAEASQVGNAMDNHGLE